MRAVNTAVTPPSLEQLAAVFGYQLKGRPLNTDEAAELRGLKRNSLEHERSTGAGPRYFKQGRIVVYSERDVLEWLVAGARRSTAENRRQERATASA
jgi:predicted DNA-binding transcriptional regulator AlpA